MESIQITNCLYTSCYCEENIYMLCKKIENLQENCLENVYAVFISNGNRTIPLWKQKSNRHPNSSVVWDYHVILAVKNGQQSLVYDFDTVLNFPCSFSDYMTNSIKPNNNLLKKFHRFFRVVPAEEFLKSFASDRSHMLNSDSTWKSLPPSYPPIFTDACSNNLQSFIDMTEDEGLGKVMNLDDFIVMFSS